MQIKEQVSEFVRDIKRRFSHKRKRDTCSTFDSFGGAPSNSGAEHSGLNDSPSQPQIDTGSHSALVTSIRSGAALTTKPVSESDARVDSLAFTQSLSPSSLEKRSTQLAPPVVVPRSRASRRAVLELPYCSYSGHHHLRTALPVLGPVDNIPDNSTLSDLPRGQVDYLSHEWREDDVLRSWRNVTRAKNEIAKGLKTPLGVTGGSRGMASKPSPQRHSTGQSCFSVLIVEILERHSIRPSSSYFVSRVWHSLSALFRF